MISFSGSRIDKCAPCLLQKYSLSFLLLIITTIIVLPPMVTQFTDASNDNTFHVSNGKYLMSYESSSFKSMKYEYSLASINNPVEYGFKFVSASNLIGTQNPQDTPTGKIVQCAGNLIMPKTICVGTNKNDTIVAPLSGGRVYANGGNDKVQGLLGGELTFGGDGNDMIQAGNGSASIFGNSGDDTLVAEVGPNIMFGNGGSMLDGGDGNDRLVGGIDHDIMIGGQGMDTFICSGKDDVVMDFDPNEDQMSGNCVII